MTCEEMILDRGYAVHSRTADISDVLQNGEPMFRAVCQGRKDLLLYIPQEDKVGIKASRVFIDYSSDASVVVVSIDGPTPVSKKECEGKDIQFLSARDMCVNRSRHFLVPRHTRVDAPPDGLQKESLPRILDSDPIVQYYGFPVGTVLRVDRVFCGNEVVPYYRVVTRS